MNISLGHLQGVIFAPSMLVVDVGSKVVVVVTLFYHQIFPHTVLLAKRATIYWNNWLWIHFVRRGLDIQIIYDVPQAEVLIGPFQVEKTNMVD